MPTRIKSPKNIAIFIKSGHILKTVLSAVSAAALPGTRLDFLDQMAFDLIHLYKAKPSFLNYQPKGALNPYPASICASLNEVIVHGIPDDKIIKEGDVLKIDIGVNYKGCFTDAAKTLIIGKKRISPSVKKLIKATEEALYAGIKKVCPENRLGDIGFAISAVAKKYKVNVIEGLAGHGIGFAPHEDPLVFNTGIKKTGQIIKEGMILALEPMFSSGSSEIIELYDGSFKTIDNSISAHFEHTVIALKNGPKILTY